MKLSAHYNKASIIITISVLLTGAIVYFFSISYFATEQFDHNLKDEFGELVSGVNQTGKLPDHVDYDVDQTTIVKIGQGDLPIRFFDTTFYNPKQQKIQKGRAVSGLVVLKTQHYIATITISNENTRYLIQVIGTITLVLMVGLLFVLFITNKYVLNGLWKPFHDMLGELKMFNLSDHKGFPLKQSKVEEFDDLNQAVHSMSLRVKNDYQHLKNFTDNASHEMMTPLAVITSKLDTLIQDESLKPEHYEQINDIYAATSKLSRLNHSLLLLVKIENNLIDDAEPLSLNLLITQKIKQFQELILAKEMEVSETLEEKKIMVSKYLIDILLNNLFSNAIRHNVNRGKLNIKLTANRLTFQNTGNDQPLNAETLFERFQKGQKSDGVGLGLTIVKNICAVYNWETSYSFENSLHTFQITF
ncbi:MAG TPA: HAMP domain-containing sensor histidine kinase [Mucilaginibacter sp.]|jgi:signal transduction histidine kinase